MKLRLVIDAAEPRQAELVSLIAAAGAAAGAAATEIVDSGAWDQRPSRLPGEAGDAAITVMLAAPPGGSLPRGSLLLAETCGLRARTIAGSCGLGPLLRGQARTSFAILMAEPEDTGGSLQILLEAGIPTLPGRRRQQRRLIATAAEALLWWLELCEQRHELVRISPRSGVQLSPGAPLRLRQRMGALLHHAASALAWRLRQSLQRGDGDWQVALAQRRGDGSLQIRHQLPPGPAGWYADPQLVEDQGQLWLFCERWDPALQRGVIAVFAVDDAGLRPEGTVLEEPFHLSFPRVFRHRGRWYATVESASQGEVRLYAVESFPHRWRLRRVLLSGAAWIDPILLPLAQGWALLVNRSPLAQLPRETAPLLELFTASDLEEPFLPHPGSPLLLDSASGRNGGLLEWHGQRLRVAQQSGFGGAYGRSVSLKRITALDGQTYREESDSLPGLAALSRRLRASHLHTLNSCGDWIAVDLRARGSWRWSWCWGAAR